MLESFSRMGGIEQILFLAGVGVVLVAIAGALDHFFEMRLSKNQVKIAEAEERKEQWRRLPAEPDEELPPVRRAAGNVRPQAPRREPPPLPRRRDAPRIEG